jgi:tRNA nucleotidyltransferase (CCA-adding enzyme)
MSPKMIPNQNYQELAENNFTYENMKPLFDMLEACHGVEQGDVHHPEGDVFTHSIQVLKWAFRESKDVDLILAAMLHDIGKQVESHGHENIAVRYLENHCSVKTLWLIKNHMRIWYFILGDMKKMSKAQELATHPWLPELILLARWDKLGRNPHAQVKYDCYDIVNQLNKCVMAKYVRPEKVDGQFLKDEQTVYNNHF